MTLLALNLVKIIDVIPSISEYSLCLLVHQQCLERKVFKVDISGDERSIAAAIDKYLNQIKDKYGIVRNNQVAILCRSNSTAFKGWRKPKVHHIKYLRKQC